jgi:uncharacterized protein (DUF952 family)
MQKYFEPIFHITTEKEWINCVGDNYYSDDFSSEGFIHFSTRKQLVNTANRIFSKRDLLFVLELEKEGLVLVFENLGGVEL